MKIKLSMVLPVVTALLLAACSQEGAEDSVAESESHQCENVTIAEMTWSSASLWANIDKVILENGFGCEVELVPGDTLAATTSMIEKGVPAIAPELWTNGVVDVLEKGVEDGKVEYVGRSLSDGGQENLWVPKYMVDQYPELATLEGVKKHAALFKNPENPGTSMMMGCPAGWNCQIANENLFRAMELADYGFELVDPGSGAGLAGSIAKAYERKEPWFGYYWAPTALLGKYEMVSVDVGAEADLEHYSTCIGKLDCESPRVISFPVANVWTVVSTEFSSGSPEVMDYLAVRSLDNALMNKLLAWMEDNQANGEIGAYEFLESYPEVWTPWVSEEVATAIKASL
ncbi:glycine betaine ABC transporter substrate-binding protein [Reinekea thalattae]|uniref:ABC transporter substrate-binding protein n=1 Tax=Reinekea thalattae TaxID=2593301 RepID=A0A5C8Z5W9_9GAMM|nr:glycine betaine ABC transporter substrate-binding protein [Reinekea thalattae]TXR53362.1 ABC transporter substrate-binding protein [Reinekea thalattae]